MSVVIVGGNERMVCQYMDICKNHGCKAKVYVKENGSLKKKLGTPDYLLLFTSTVSHKMMLSASKEAKRNNIPIAYVPSSSASALHSVLADCCAAVRGECAFIVRRRWRRLKRRVYFPTTRRRTRRTM